MWSKIWIFTRCSNTVEHPCGDTVTTYGQKIHMYENSFNFSKFKKKKLYRAFRKYPKGPLSKFHNL